MRGRGTPRSVGAEPTLRFLGAAGRATGSKSGAERVKVHGRYIPVRARVEQLDVFSAHADQAELLAWLGGCERAPRQVFVTHGERPAADSLRRRIVEDLGMRARAPEHDGVHGL